ncbi:MAG: Polynucleotide 5'-hydroxyl-kinase grc3 [Geoglossum simile]|nr:MAG: Polynucleotide 5'-hydroxyl-kinase grc3 [Geoglossum simile]
MRGRTSHEGAGQSALSAVAARKLAGGDRNKADNSKRRVSPSPAQHQHAKSETERLKNAIKPKANRKRVKKTYESTAGFSSFELDEKVIANEEKDLILQLQPRDKLVVSGEFSILVKSGKFSIMGAVLRPSPQIHEVSAPLCHSLPIIECISSPGVSSSEISIRHCNSGVRFLQSTIPLFKHIWGGSLKVGLGRQRSFTTLHNVNDTSKTWKFKVQTLNLPKKWKQLISVLTGLVGQEAPLIIAVAGQQSAGKSTFCRHLYNSILTHAVLENTEGCDGVAFLDLDPGQPEFSPPGQVSLFHLRSPLLGPPFRQTHISLANDERLLRSHHIGYTTPENDPDHYVACAVDLFTQYQKLLFNTPSCPLIINTVGCVKAIGMEILFDLLKPMLTTHLIWLQSDVDLEEELALDQKSLPGVTTHRISSHHIKNMSRTPADLRAMQVLSYLHLSPELSVETDWDGHGLQWNATPLTHQRPWVVNYSEPKPGILGILILGEVLPVELVATAINGTIVAIVAIEDDDALPTVGGDREISSDRKGRQRSIVFSVVHDPATSLPYIPTPGGSPLDPTKTFCVGQALIRGIDTENKTLHLLTPIQASHLPANKKLVLVRGRTELPAVAFVEDGKISEKPYLSLEKTEHTPPMAARAEKGPEKNAE